MPDLPPSDRSLRILAVTRKPDVASFEHRVAGFFEVVRDRGHDVNCESIPTGLRKQWRLFSRFRDYDVIWWQRHLAMPQDLPLIRMSAKRLIFDFDDPLTWSAKHGGTPSWSRRVRFAWTLRICDAVTTASEHLASMARPYCDDIRVIPMPVDVPDDPPNLVERAERPTLLWLGSRATQPYLELIRGVLESLAGEVVLRLVAHEPMSFGTLEVDFRRWSPEEQESALRESHVGLCPMPDTPWTRGKCPYKVLQSMAYGMPWVGSAVGENLHVAGSQEAGRGERGWCASTERQWLEAIRTLIQDRVVSGKMASAAREYVRDLHDRNRLEQAVIGALEGQSV